MSRHAGILRHNELAGILTSRNYMIQRHRRDSLMDNHVVSSSLRYPKDRHAICYLDLSRSKGLSGHFTINTCVDCLMAAWLSLILPPGLVSPHRTRNTYCQQP